MLNNEVGIRARYGQEILVILEGNEAVRRQLACGPLEGLADPGPEALVPTAIRAPLKNVPFVAVGP